MISSQDAAYKAFSEAKQDSGSAASVKELTSARNILSLGSRDRPGGRRLEVLGRLSLIG